MLLDGSYFNSLELGVEKNKYYKVSDVDDILVDIRKRAEAQAKEIEDLRTRLEKSENDKAELQKALGTVSAQREEIGDAVLSVRNACKSIIEKANAQAGEMLEKANQQAEAITSEAREKAQAELERGGEHRSKKEEYYISQIEKMYDRMRQSHVTAIDELNDDWQQFLAGLSDEESASVGASKGGSRANGACSGETPDTASVSDKISRIAKEINGI